MILVVVGFVALALPGFLMVAVALMALFSWRHSLFFFGPVALAIGAVILLAVGALLLVTGGALLATRISGRRRADGGRPGTLLAAGAVAVVLGASWAFSAGADLRSVVWGGSTDEIIALGGSLLLLVLGLALASVGAGGIVRERPRASSLTDDGFHQAAAPVLAAGAPRGLTHRPWSTILAVGFFGGMAFGAFMVVAGIYVAMAPTSGPDAYGVVFGPVFSFVGVVVLVVAGGLLVLTISGRRRADRGQPGLLMAAGVTATALGMGPAAATVFGLASPGGVYSYGVWIPFVVTLVVFVPGIAIVRVARPGSAPRAGQATRDLPGR